ncbi:MAG: TetR/AcrR family transcriptional regulator [Cyclobacteriaceae bacterium]
MAGRPRKFKEDEVIQKACDVFWEKGYAAASSEDLLQAMNMGKGSFYLHFKDGKEELFKRTLDFRAKQSLQKIRTRLAETNNKVEVLKSLFHERLNTEEYFKNYGCFLGNTIVEMSNLNAELKELAAHYLKQLEQVFEEVISEAQENKRISSTKPPRFIARYLINIWNGMNITKRMNGSNDILKEVVGLQLQILD